MINVTKTSLPPIDKYIKYLKKIWANNWVTNDGEFTRKLENNLEKYLGIKNLLALANGTLALHLAFKALGLKGEIITTPFTFPATTNTLIWEGLKPIFADIDLETFSIDPEAIERKINRNTSAILAVHVFGNPCNVEAIEKLAQKYNLKVIYDAAHAFGVEYKGKSILRWGDISTMSFHATKIFHTAEGGAVITKDRNLYKKIQLLRNHGIQSYEKVTLAGTNAKMNELEAIMGLCLLDNFNTLEKQRKKRYMIYYNAFSRHPKIRLQKINSSRYNYSYFPVCFSSESMRNKIFKSLLKNGFRARKYFYPPTHELPYTHGSNEKLPNSTLIAHTVLCLPLYPDLPIREIKKVIDIVLVAI